MDEKPKRRWFSFLKWMLIATCISVVGFESVNFVRNARESGEQDRLRVEVRAGRADPKKAKDILSKQEFEQLNEAWSKRMTK